MTEPEQKFKLYHSPGLQKPAKQITAEVMTTTKHTKNAKEEKRFKRKIDIKTRAEHLEGEVYPSRDQSGSHDHYETHEKREREKWIGR